MVAAKEADKEELKIKDIEGTTKSKSLHKLIIKLIKL